MNGITHKQAKRHMRADLDGLLNAHQSLDLQAHLRECDACRAESESLALLTARLQSGFHNHWDKQNGPSTNVMANVHSQTRRIMLMNRINTGLRAVGGVAALLVLMLAINSIISQVKKISVATNGTQSTEDGTAVFSSQTDNRLIAFTSIKDGNYDIYTMHADGSGLTNITNNPAFDSSPYWSPDGKRIAFESGRDGSWGQVYLMNADGSDVVQVTHDQVDHQFVRNYGASSSPWSPDGSRLIISQKLPGEEKWTLYTVEARGENKIQLVSESNTYNAISWSPDGRHIAFIADNPQSLDGDRLYIVNEDGSNLRDVTESLLSGEQLFNFDYYWADDGQSIFFVAFSRKAEPYWTAYEARLDDNSLIERATTNTALYHWQNKISVVGEFSIESPIKWSRSDETNSTLHPYEHCTQKDGVLFGSHVKRSSNGNWAINAYCPNGDFWFYYANSDGTMIKQLLNSPLSAKDSDLIDILWSPDDKFIAFNMASANQSDLYILDVSEALKDPSIQPVKMTNSYGASWMPVENKEITENNPTPEPERTSSYEGLIAFASENVNSSNPDRNLEIYTMRADGSDITNITNDPANDSNPVWSPDGKRIAFLSERKANWDIFSMNPNGSKVIQLTDSPGYDGFFEWSPDGTKIIYSASPGNDSNVSQLIVMNADGSNKITLTESGSYIFLGWSSNGQKIVYQKQNLETNNPQDNEIHVVDINGANHYQWHAIVDEIRWTDDEHFIGHGWSGVSEPPSWKLYKFDVNGGDLVEIATTPARIVALFDQTYLVEDVRTLEWYSMGGNTAPLKSWDFSEHCTKPGDRFLQETDHKISPNESRAFVTVHCSDSSIWFYLENADGSMFKPLTSVSIPDPLHIMNLSWSSDEKYLLLTIANPGGGYMDLYLLDVERMLKGPATEPIKLTVDEAWRYGYEAAIQPQP